MPELNDRPDAAEDRLRAGLHALYTDALPHIRPPGVDLVRRGARRRAAGQTTAGVVLVAVMAVAAFTQPWRALTGNTPLAPPSTTHASAEPTRTAAPSVTALVTGAGGAATPTGSATGGDSETGDGCQRTGVVDVTELMNYGYVTVSVRLPSEHPDWWGLICPGERVRVYWASYTVDPAGVQHLYRSEERFLDMDTPRWRMYIDMKWNGLCGPTWYVGRGNDPVPATIPLGGSAFPHKFHWDDDNAVPGCDPTPIPS